MDTSEPLNPDNDAYYQFLIGILGWIVEVGGADICLEIVVMSLYLVLPREDHLLKLFRFLDI